MTKKFQELMKEYFPRGGNTKTLGVTKKYLSLLENNILDPSPALLAKISKNYEVPLNELFNKEKTSSKGVNLLLFTSENLSQSDSFTKKLNRHEQISEENLVDIIGSSYTDLHIRGRLSTILTNISNYFVLSNTEDFSGSRNGSSINFNFYAGLKNPLVCLHHESISPENFIEVSEKKDFKTYSVNKEFIPLNVKSIRTNSDLWKPRFSEGKPRVPGVFDTDSNKILVEYKKPVSQTIINTLRDEVDDPFNNPDFYTLSNGVLGSLFDEHFFLSRLNKDNFEKLEVFYRPAVSLKDNHTLIFHFYPLQILASATQAGGGNNYWPGPGTLRIANRYQNFTEGRTSSKK